MSLNSQIADLILERGRAQAQGQAASGQAWGVALSQIGNTLAQLPQEIRRDKIVNQQQQMGKLQIESAQRQGEHEIDVQRTRQAIDGMANDPSVLNEDGTFNIKSITAKLSQMPDGGVGPVQRLDTKTIFDTLDPINQSLSQARDSQLKYQEHKANALAGLAAGALRLGKEDGNYFSHAGSALASAQKSGLLTPDEVTQTLTQLVEHQDRIPQILGDFVAKSTLPPIKVNKDQILVNALDPETVLATGPKSAPTPTELALQATGGDPKAAINLLHPQAPHPVEQQLLEAIASGDTQKADQIKRTMQEAAQARRDPAAQALAAELGGLRKEQAQARLDEMTKKAEPLDVSPDIQTTASGRKYIDLSLYTGVERDKARKAANDVGAVSISKEQANALQEIDNARANQKSILDQVGDLLPKDPTGRVIAAPKIKLEKLFQTDVQKAAYNSWRTAAIQTLRATAGSKGLRINQAEIAQAIENDIPKLTDTLDVAKQKVSNINTMLENAEKSILVRDHSAEANTPAPQTRTIRNVKTGETKTQTSTDGGATWK